METEYLQYGAPARQWRGQRLTAGSLGCQGCRRSHHPQLNWPTPGNREWIRVAALSNPASHRVKTTADSRQLGLLWLSPINSCSTRLLGAGRKGTAKQIRRGVASLPEGLSPGVADPSRLPCCFGGLSAYSRCLSLFLRSRRLRPGALPLSRRLILLWFVLVFDRVRFLLGTVGLAKKKKNWVAIVGLLISFRSPIWIKFPLLPTAPWLIASYLFTPPPSKFDFYLFYTLKPLYLIFQFSFNTV